MRAGDAEHVMAEPLDEAFNIHRDQRLIFDDEHVGRDFAGEFLAGFVKECAQRGRSTSRTRAVSSSEKPSSDISRNACRGQGRELGDAGLGRQLGVGTVAGAVHAHRIPDLGEDAIEADARVFALRQTARISYERLKDRAYIGVARILTAGQSTCVTPQKRQVASNKLGYGHQDPPRMGIASDCITQVAEKGSIKMEPLAPGGVILLITRVFRAEPAPGSREG